MTRQNLRESYKTIAAERIQRLFELADETFNKNQALADRYVKLAWRLKTRYTLKLPPHLKRKFCKKCLSFWKPGVSCRVRIQSGCVTVTCLRCGHVARLPYKPRESRFLGEKR